MKLIFVRHGQSVYNSENRFTGWHNPPLTKTGEEYCAAWDANVRGEYWCHKSQKNQSK